VTPFTEDGRKIDAGALRRLIEFQVTEGIHGLIPLGSTGESLSVSDDERDEIVETVVKQAAGRVPVVPGCTAENTNDAIRYARSAERLGADGVMVMTPYYAALDEDEIGWVRPHASGGQAAERRQHDPLHQGIDHRRAAGDADPAALRSPYDGLRRLSWLRVVRGRSPLIDFLGEHLYVHGMKAAFRMIDMPMGDPRPPRLRLKPALAAQLRDILTGMGFTLAGRP
jgi:dihydrodipicolinate synthase/N-acetylneuraminate lyase